MNDTIPRSPQEQEVFQRVWQRVMAGRPEASAVLVPEPSPRWVEGDVSTDYLASLRPEPTVPADVPSGDMGAENPPNPCTLYLRQQTLEALEAWQFYRHLARRSRGNAARVLTNLAADQHRQARKLAAAYFLHSGVRYWPSEQLPTPVIPSFWGALRQRHQAEQQAELSYRMASSEAQEDSTLPELYRELMEGCRERCRQLRALLEQSCP